MRLHRRRNPFRKRSFLSLAFSATRSNPKAAKTANNAVAALAVALWKAIFWIFVGLFALSSFFSMLDSVSSNFNWYRVVGVVALIAMVVVIRCWRKAKNRDNSLITMSMKK